MHSFVSLLDSIFSIYNSIVWVYCIISMLYGFGALERKSNFIYTIYTSLSKLVEPALNIIRKIIPTFGVMDFSPMILVLGLQFIHHLMFEWFL